MGTTTIEWTDATWNPTKGCDRVSPGCDHCYAMTQAVRLKAMKSPAYQLDGNPATSGPGFLAHEWPDALDWPLRKTKPLLIFVNSMSDLFHDNISDDFIARVFAVMALAPQHTFQILTKRHARMRSLLGGHGTFCTRVAQAMEPLVKVQGYSDEHLSVHASEWWPLPNVWLGVSVENQQWANIRIPALLGTPAAVRFLSCEPLLGPVDLTKAIEPNFARGGWKDLSRLHWVIGGGESGPGARPMHPDWARSLRDQCAAAEIPFLFKQWGAWVGHAMGGDPSGNGRSPWADRDPEAYINADTGQPSDTNGHGMWLVGKHAAGRELDGRTWDEYPAMTAVAR